MTWTLAATSFSKYSGANKTADEDGTYVADVTLKSGRDVVSMPVTFSWVEVKSGNLKCKCGVASSDEFSAFQNLWKRADTKAAAPVFKKAIDAFLPNTLALQFKKDGVVSFAGNLTGAKISGTSQLIPNGDGNWAAVLHVPPKNGVPGYNELVDVKLTVDALNVVTAVEVAPAK